MLMLNMLMMLTLGGPTPMKVLPGDPILNLELKDRNNQKTMLKDVMHHGFVFFVSHDCPNCIEALNTIEHAFEGELPYVLLITEQESFNWSFIERKNIDPSIAFTVDPNALTPYQITTLPALIGYQQGRLKIAFHGPLNPKTANKVINIYHKEF